MKSIIITFIIMCSAFLVQAQTTKLHITGGNVNVNGASKIVLNDVQWINDGTFSAGSSEVEISGTASSANTTIGGTSTTSFYELKINKSSNDVTLAKDIEVTNELTLSSGKLLIDDYLLTMDNTAAISNFNSDRYIKTDGTGGLIREVGASNVVFPVGNSTYTPLSVQNSGTTDAFFIRTSAEVLENGNSGNALTTDVVDRTWFVEEGVAGGSNLTLTATWNAADELTGFDRTQSYLSHYTGSGWNASVPGAASGSNPYSISRSGITTLSPFAVGSNGALPIELFSFTALRRNEYVQLEWITVTEINSDLFEIEHSRDGILYEKVGEVTAAGFSSSELNYDFLHKNPVKGLNYYRLKQLDYDGAFEYSDIVSVQFLEGGRQLAVYPNPVFGGPFTLSLSDSNFELAELSIYDSVGRLVQSQTILDTNTEIQTGDFPKGIYLVSMEVDGLRFLERVVVQ